MSFIHLNNKKDQVESQYSADVIKLALLKAETKSNAKASGLVENIKEPVSLSEALSLFSDKLKGIKYLTESLSVIAIEEAAALEASKTELTLEGTMSEIHMLAQEAKDVVDFTKKFFKEFGDKIKKSADSTQWVESLYTDAVSEDHSENPNDIYDVRPCDKAGTPWSVWEGDVQVKCFETEEEAEAYATEQNKEQGLTEGYDGDMSDFKYEFPMRFEEETGNSPKAIKKMAKQGKKGYEVRTSTYMSQTEMERVGLALGLNLKSYTKGSSVAISVYESTIIINEDFSRMSSGVIGNELYAASQALTTYYDWLKAGNDSGKGKSLDHIISLLKKCKSSIKRFKTKEETIGTEYEASMDEATYNESVVTEAKGFKNTTDFEKFLIEIDGMGESQIKKIMGKDYIDTPGYYKDEKGNYDGVEDFMLSNMGTKEFEKLESWWENNVAESVVTEGNVSDKDFHKTEEVEEEQQVDEARFVKDFNEDVLDAKTKEEVLKLYPNAEFFVGKSDHFFGELDDNLFFKAYYTKAQKEFSIKSVYSKKGSNYVHLYNRIGESVVNEGRSINKIQTEWSQTTSNMVQKVADWKAAEGDRKIELLEELKALTAKKKELELELDAKVAGKDKDVKLAIEGNTFESVVTESKLNEKEDSATHLDNLADLVGNAKSFMDVGKELKAGKYKYDFSTGMMPVYMVQADGFKFAILNKQYVDKGDREVGAIAIGLMESVVNEAKFKKGQYIKAKSDSDDFDGDVYDKTNDVDGSEILKNSSFEIYEIGKDEVILWSDADEVEYSIDPDDLKNFVKESVVTEKKEEKDEAAEIEAEIEKLTKENKHGYAKDIKRLKVRLSAVNMMKKFNKNNESKKVAWDNLLEEFEIVETTNEGLRSDVKNFIKDNKDELNDLADADKWDMMYQKLYDEFGVESDTIKAKDLLKTFQFVF